MSKETLTDPATSHKEAPIAQSEETKTVEFENGSVSYSLIGKSNPEHHPIVWVSGHEQGRINPKDVAEILAEKGHRQVLILDQPIYNSDVTRKTKLDENQALNFDAKAYLAACKDAGLIGKDLAGEVKVVDTAAHSFGALILDRLKLLAEKQGVDSFKQENGSRIALLAPTGSNDQETVFRLAGRWFPYIRKTVAEVKALDPTKEKGKALQKNVKADLPKAIGEVKAMVHQKINYDQFGEALLVIYPEDKQFPENEKAIKSRGKGLINDLTGKELPVAIATPINPRDVALKGLDLWLTKFWLKGRKGRLDFALSHRGAGHNEPTDNPVRTADLLLSYFDHGASVPIERIKEAERKYLEKQRAV